MGNYKIEIEAFGGHGCDRTAKAGDAISYLHETSCPDCIAHDLVHQLASRGGGSVVYAKLTHWPDKTPIVDDLLNGKRIAGDFDAPGDLYKSDQILEHFEFSHLPPHLAEVSRGFCHAAYAIVATLPSSAERSVALRKLLEGKDAAVRAARKLAPQP